MSLPSRVLLHKFSLIVKRLFYSAPRELSKLKILTESIIRHATMNQKGWKFAAQRHTTCNKTLEVLTRHFNSLRSKIWKSRFTVKQNRISIIIDYNRMSSGHCLPTKRSCTYTYNLLTTKFVTLIDELGRWATGQYENDQQVGFARHLGELREQTVEPFSGDCSELTSPNSLAHSMAIDR